MSALKEPNFFALRKGSLPTAGPAPAYVLEKMLYNWSELDESKYYKLFEDAQENQAAGEASVRYLYFPDAPDRIHAAMPEVRLVAILREPVSRMFSHYNMNVQNHLEPLSFDMALEAELERIRAGWGWDWHYAAVSRYAEQVKRYIDVFGRESIAVFLYEDLVSKPQAVLERIYTHLGVASGFRPDMSRRGKVPSRSRLPRLDRALTWPHPAKDMLGQSFRRKADAGLRKMASLLHRPAPRLDPEVRARHAASFRESNEELSDLLCIKLPW